MKADSVPAPRQRRQGRPVRDEVLHREEGRRQRDYGHPDPPPLLRDPVAQEQAEAQQTQVKDRRRPESEAHKS